MRKFLLLTTLAAVAVVAAGITVQAQTYGPGMMRSDQDNGSRRGSGMMGGNYSSGYMMGPGMMGYGSADERGRGYRGNRMCWKETDPRGYGYYAPCSN